MLAYGRFPEVCSKSTNVRHEGGNCLSACFIQQTGTLTDRSFSQEQASDFSSRLLLHATIETGK